MRCERPTVNFVIGGRSAPNSLKVFSKTGIRNATIAISTIPAKLKMTVG